MIYSVFLYLHIFSVIPALGPFFLLFPMVRKLRTADTNELKLYIPTFTFAVKLSKHSGHVLVPSGVILMWLGHISWLTSWVLLTIFILMSSLFFIARAFSPSLRKLALPDHQNRQKLVNKLRNSLLLYVVLMMIMLGFMIVKPSYW